MYSVDFYSKLVIHQTLLYGHIVVFALALAEVLREDWRMLRAARLDIRELEDVAERMKWLLILLWATGVPLVGIILDWNFSLLVTKPKLLTKTIVVLVLTLNGAMLHAAVLPMLRNRRMNPRYTAMASCVVGAVSTVSWLYASFVGVARLIAPKLGLFQFVGLYVTLLAGGLAFALLILRQRVEHLIANRNRAVRAEDLSHPSNGELLVLLRQLEQKILARDASGKAIIAHT